MAGTTSSAASHRAGVRLPAGVQAAGLVLIASSGVQISALLAHSLFDRISPSGVSGLRFAVAGLIAVVLVRPRLRGRTPRQWAAIGCFGLAIASMNVALYEALLRLPFGIALTLEFLGPFAVAVSGARRPAAALFPVIGLAGVVLVLRPGGVTDLIGVAFALLAAVSVAAYTVLAEYVGRREQGLDGLALALVMAALLTSPYTVTAAPSVRSADLTVLVAAAVLGVVIAFSADFWAVRSSSARTVAVLLAFDPALAVLLGAVVLGQALDAVSLIGVTLVAVAGCGSAAIAGSVSRALNRTGPFARMPTVSPTSGPSLYALPIPNPGQSGQAGADRRCVPVLVQGTVIAAQTRATPASETST